MRPSTINRVLMDQTCFGRSGGLAPISFPLFQGVWGWLFEGHSSFSGMGRAPRLLRSGSLFGRTRGRSESMPAFRGLRSYAGHRPCSVRRF